MMKKAIILLLGAVAVLSGCSKTTTVNTNDAAKRYFEAFIKVNYPDAVKTDLGAYVIEEEIGKGKALGDTAATPYVLVEYTVTDLEGNIASTTSGQVARKIGIYDPTSSFYGPVVWYRPSYSVYAGLEESLKRMNVGGRRKVAVPGWLLSNDSYSTAAEFEANCSGDNAIFDFKVVEAITDIEKWELDSIAHYLSRNFPGVAPGDSAVYGYYYIERKAPVDTTKFPEDTTFYINYIGRLLDGTVFDTNIKDSAKFYGIYNSSSDYEPSAITYDSDEGVFQMGGGDVITGFSMTLARMRKYGRSTAIFYSDLGYGTSGSGAIPAFSPLRFDVDVVDAPKDDD